MLATSSAKSIKGLEEWKAFQNTYSSKASRSLDTDSPDQNQMLADGTTSAILANSAALSAVKTINSSVKCTRRSAYFVEVVELFGFHNSAH